MVSSQVAPPKNFHSQKLKLLTLPIGENYERLYINIHKNPLGCGNGYSRFSPQKAGPAGQRFQVLYLGTTIQVCFLEAFLRDARNGKVGDWPISEKELANYDYAQISNTNEIKVVDLTGNGSALLRVPSDVTGAADQTLSRQWSECFYDHPDKPDGILYHSRLNHDKNLAVYDHAIFKFKAKSPQPFLKHPKYVDLLDDLEIALVE